MATASGLNKLIASRGRNFTFLVVAGAIVVVLGVLAPRLLTDPTVNLPEARPDASEKALPPLDKPMGAFKGFTSDKEGSNPSSELPEPPSLGAILARLVGGTLAVLVLCAGVTYGVARWMKTRTLVAPQGPLKVVAALPINPRCSIVLIQAGDQHLVAGLDATGLRTILHLLGGIGETETEEKPPLAESADATGVPPPVMLATRGPVTRAGTDPPARLLG